MKINVYLPSGMLYETYSAYPMNTPRVNFWWIQHHNQMYEQQQMFFFFFYLFVAMLNQNSYEDDKVNN